MSTHVLHLITTGKQTLEEVTARLSHCPPNCIDALHIREKSRSAKEILDWYNKLRTALPGTAIYVNDRLDAAAAVAAPGVQLGYTSLPPYLARTIMPQGTRIGLSVHSLDEAARARAEGADYILFGHIFATGSKEGLAPRGLEALAAVVNAAEAPVIAIGGIEPGNVEDVLSTGCAGIAVLSGILAHDDPAGQTLRYREKLDGSRYTPKIAF
ncbi:thiamine phosphate synthase [Paenibacillus sp. MBLB4367]|uniref:thiamine phosphate synthase n=1 Tax=Paenibacillus sp. MBLB4367 TaxID=3384767 RepID=UPI003907F682